jgi:hypothetical protein
VVFFKLSYILGSTRSTKPEMHTFLRLVDQSKLKPVLDRTLALEELQAVHTYMTIWPAK